MVETRFEFKYHVSPGEVRAELEGLEIMKLQMNAANFAQAMQQNIIAADPQVFLHMADEDQRQEIYAGVKARFAKLGIEVSEEVLRQNEEQALREMGHHYIKESVEAAVKRIEEQLPKIMQMVNDKVLGAAFFSGANILREILQQPKGKYTAREIKDQIFEKDWNLIKPLIGVQTGGARNVKHKWTDTDRACLATRYAELQPIWIEAKKIAKNAQDSLEGTRRKNWRKEVLAVYDTLPADLLERFVALRADDAKPSDIAILHAGRLCLPETVELSVGRLRKELTEWKNKKRV